MRFFNLPMPHVVDRALVRNLKIMQPVCTCLNFP